MNFKAVDLGFGTQRVLVVEVKPQVLNSTLDSLTAVVELNKLFPSALFVLAAREGTRMRYRGRSDLVAWLVQRHAGSLRWETWSVDARPTIARKTPGTALTRGEPGARSPGLVSPRPPTTVKPISMTMSKDRVRLNAPTSPETLVAMGIGMLVAGLVLSALDA